MTTTTAEFIADQVEKIRALEKQLRDAEQSLSNACATLDEQRDTIEQLKSRNGNAVEVLDSIRALLNGERHPDDAERIVAMINGFLASVRK